MSLSRFTDRDTARADDRLEQLILASGIARWGPPREVFLAVAGDEGAVDHGLDAVPDGYLMLLTVGGQVAASRPENWTPTTAYLVADANNVRARVLFVTVREEILDG